MSKQLALTIATPYQLQIIAVTNTSPGLKISAALITFLFGAVHFLVSIIPEIEITALAIQAAWQGVTLYGLILELCPDIMFWGLG